MTNPFNIDRTVTTGREEFHLRVERLMEERGMTERAATVVVKAAMYGDGCVESTVRARIERENEIIS